MLIHNLGFNTQENPHMKTGEKTPRNDIRLRRMVTGDGCRWIKRREGVGIDYMWGFLKC